MKRILHIVAACLGFIQLAHAQCNLQVTPSQASYCAGESITFEITNNQPGRTYQITVPALGITVNDTIAHISFPGGSTVKNYPVYVNINNPVGGWLSCNLGQPSAIITINPSPDPTLNDENPTSGLPPFTQCAGSSYDLTIRNSSSTTATNSSYTINWGDGNITGPITSWTTLTHTYTVKGQYVLSYTVTDNSISGPCKTVTHDYLVYFGITPDRGIEAPGQVTLCAPLSVPFKITNTANNTPGTTYEIYVDGQLDTIYNHPPPATHSITFTSSSCHHTYCGLGSPDKYCVLLIAKNACGASQIQLPVRVGDIPIAQFIGPDTVCRGDEAVYKNLSVATDFDFSTGSCITPKLADWKITPATGWTLTGGSLSQSETIKVRFTTSGTYKIEMYITTPCGDDTTYHLITVLDSAKAIVNYVAPLCFPTPGPVDVPFTNTSTGDSLKYRWEVDPAAGTSFVGGTSDTSKNPIIRFTSGGKYDVTLIILNACNRPAWKGTVNLKYKPDVDTNAIPDGCFPPYSFKPYDTTRNYFVFDNGGDDSAKYNWTFTGGSPAGSTLKDPGMVTFNASGTFPIKVSITNVCGTDSVTQNVKVLNNIVPDAGPDFNVCTSSPTQTLAAVPSGGVWHGNGIIDTTLGKFNPNGLAAGKDTIVYILNPKSNCPTYDTLIITVVEINGLTAGPPQSICKQSGALSLANDPAFPGGTWFGSGVINPKPGLFDPTGFQPGVYQVGYIYSDPTGVCTDTAFKDITVFDSVRVDYNIPPLCAGQAFNFGSTTGNIQSAIWDFGDGTPLVNQTAPTHTYNNPGNYNIKVLATTPDGCKDTIFIPVSVSEIPPLKFNVSPQVSCDGLNITFTFPPGHVAADKYTWDFGNGNIVITLTPDQQIMDFPKPVLRDTNYNVLLTADYHCGPAFYFDTVKVKPNPKAKFGTSQNGCSPFTPNIFNLSYGSPDTYTWDFGNGQTGSGFNPAPPTYINNSKNDTTFKIKLTATNSCGVDTFTNSITVLGNKVTANMITSTTQGCQPLDVQFSSFVNPVDATVFWDFGDGGTSFDENPAYTFNNFGVFKVKLIATTNCGKDSVSTNITVHPKPHADIIMPANLCAGKPATFINSSTGASSYVWTFSNGIISGNTNQTRTFDSVGGYTVKLVATSNKNCSDSIEKAFGIYPVPTAAFSVQTPVTCEGEPTIFINTSNAPNFLWYFGNGETSTEPRPNYVYPAPGTYDVTLVAINGGCRDSMRRSAAIQINPSPDADFTYTLTGPDLKSPVEFTNITVNGTSFNWQFGDTATSTERDPVHLYSGYGPYRVTLIAENQYGCLDTVQHAIGVDYDGTLYAPNAFAPELGNGNNALFKPAGINLIEYKVQVFSTYGQLLWESDKIDAAGSPVEGWDGTFKGKLMPQDVYVWKIRAIFADGKAWEGMKDPKTGKKSVMGSVVLLR